jgi:hypothetical protein
MPKSHRNRPPKKIVSLIFSLLAGAQTSKIKYLVGLMATVATAIGDMSAAPFVGFLRDRKWDRVTLVRRRASCGPMHSEYRPNCGFPCNPDSDRLPLWADHLSIAAGHSCDGATSLQDWARRRLRLFCCLRDTHSNEIRLKVSPLSSPATTFAASNLSRQ